MRRDDLEALVGIFMVILFAIAFMWGLLYFFEFTFQVLADFFVTIIKAIKE